jgi:multidrug efflux pump subunit AcrA (membrane-fusion protein)
VSVEESKLPLVKVGQSVEVALEALDYRVTARVSEIVPAVDAASRAYIVKIDLPAIADLRSGIFGRAWFPLGTNEVVVVPPAALVERGQLETVFVLENGYARTRLVTTGRRTQNGIEVLSGLSEGEKVANPIPAGLADGSPVGIHR